jgi:hypothetical protein
VAQFARQLSYTYQRCTANGIYRFFPAFANFRFSTLRILGSTTHLFTLCLRRVLYPPLACTAVSFCTRMEKKCEGEETHRRAPRTDWVNVSLGLSSTTSMSVFDCSLISILHGST